MSVIPSISVIIPTYNGATNILNTLKALNNQTILDFEVIIAIDGSTDNTKAIVADFNYQFGALHIYEWKNSGRAGIRNKGSNKASGELFIFSDDDMVPQPDVIERHLSFHQKHKNSICTGNQVEPLEHALTDFDRFRCYTRKKWNKKFGNDLNKINKDNIFLTAANFSIPKKIFEHLKGFNEQLSDNEDLDLAIRAINEGYTIYFDKSILSLHFDFMSCKKYINRRREYTLSYQNLHNLSASPLIKKRLLKPGFAKKLIFSIFSQNYWVSLIDKNSLTFLPLTLRYKIYDLVITGLGSVYLNRKI